MKKTKSSENWAEFLSQIGREDFENMILPPQLILDCRVVSMAARLEEALSKSAKSILSGETEIIEFADGEAAVRFPLKEGKDILPFIGMVGRADLGTDPLVIRNGIALRLPFSERQQLRQLLGITQIFAGGKESQIGKDTIVFW